MVHRQEEHVVGGAQPDEARPQQRPLGEVERKPGLLAGQAPSLGLALRLRDRGEIDDGQGHESLARDSRRRPSIDRGEGRAQDLVPPHDLPEAALEGAHAEVAAVPEGQTTGCRPSCAAPAGRRTTGAAGRRRAPGPAPQGHAGSGEPAGPLALPGGARSCGRGRRRWAPRRRPGATPPPRGSRAAERRPGWRGASGLRGRRSRREPRPSRCRAASPTCPRSRARSRRRAPRRASPARAWGAGRPAAARRPACRPATRASPRGRSAPAGRRSRPRSGSSAACPGSARRRPSLPRE